MVGKIKFDRLIPLLQFVYMLPIITKSLRLVGVAAAVGPIQHHHSSAQLQTLSHRLAVITSALQVGCHPLWLTGGLCSIKLCLLDCCHPTQPLTHATPSHWWAGCHPYVLHWCVSALLHQADVTVRSYSWTVSLLTYSWLSPTVLYLKGVHHLLSLKTLLSLPYLLYADKL